VAPAIYQHQDGAFYASGFARGPWDPEAQHGGAAAAILMRALEALDDGGADLQIARVTYELVKPVPLGELHVSAQIIRPGRRVQLLEGSLRTPDGTEVLKARALRVARAPLSAGHSPDAPVPGYEGARESLSAITNPEGYVGGAMEIRFVRGHFDEPGPAVAWLRLKIPVLEGEAPSPLQRLVAAADFPNGISTELSWQRYLFINPDLTVYIEREPRGEWIGLDAHMNVLEGGVGLAQAVLYDEQGRVGRSLQSLYVAER